MRSQSIMQHAVPVEKERRSRERKEQGLEKGKQSVETASRKERAGSRSEINRSNYTQRPRDNGVTEWKCEQSSKTERRTEEVKLRQEQHEAVAEEINRRGERE